RNWLEKNASKDNPTEITRLNFLGEMGLTPEMTINELFVIDVAQGNNATQITKDSRNHGAASFSPDGSRIVYASVPETIAHPDKVRRSAIWMMNADGSNSRAVLSDEKLGYNAAQFSKDGKSLVVSTTETDEPGFRQTK